MQFNLALNFPFSNAAKALAKTTALTFSIDDLEYARELATQVIAGRARTWPASSEQESLKLYANSRLLCFASQNYAVQREFATNYAKIVKLIIKSNENLLQELAADLITSLRQENQDEYSVDVFELLAIAPDLSNANLAKGRVKLNTEQLTELIANYSQIKTLDYSGLDLTSIPSQAITIAATLKDALPAKVQAKAEGKALTRPYMQKILQGVGEGKRFYGAMALAIACQMDGLSKEAAVNVLEEYCKNCSQGANQFTIDEAKAALEWTYKRPSIRLSYEKLKSQGLVTDDSTTSAARKKTERETKNKEATA